MFFSEVQEAIFAHGPYVDILKCNLKTLLEIVPIILSIAIVYFVEQNSYLFWQKNYKSMDIFTQHNRKEAPESSQWESNGSIYNFLKQKTH